MVIRHKKNTAYYLAVPMIDAATPASFKTGLTVADTAYYKDAAGAWTSLSIADTFSEIGATGIYEIDLIASELNHDKVIIKMTSAGAADSLVIFEMDSIEIDDIPTTPMRGTDSAALASVCTDARLAELAAANLPADIAAIPTTAMRGTDNAALASVCTDARLSELAAANLPDDVDTLLARCLDARLAELDAGNLPTDIAAIPTNPALDTVCTEPRLAELDAANLPAVTDGIKTKTDVLPASWNMTDLAAVPGINATAIQALNFIYCLVRNKKITNKTNKEIELYKDNSTTKFAESDIDDNGTLFTQSKFGAPD